MLILPAYAKVNLCLAVRARRRDGFHDIDSVMLPVDWHDLVAVRLRGADVSAVQLRVSGPAVGDLPGAERNLVTRAATAVSVRTGHSLDAWLDKHVPAQAGLGGGSSDAATVLRACHLALRSCEDGSQLSTHELHQIAAQLGSDVPALLAGGPQRMTGRGDVLVPLSVRGSWHLVVVLAGRGATGVAYHALGVEEFDRDSDRIDRVAAALSHGALPADDDLGSGLEAPAARSQPVLAAGLVRVRSLLSTVRWHLTGSGGAVFALVPTRDAATHLAGQAREAGFVARACRTVT